MLTPDKLAAIDRHLRKENWLLTEDLITELTDHYVTGLEDRMATGMTFDAALRGVHTGFGGRRGLLKMEEEFVTSQYQNSRRMFKQAMWSYFQMPKLIYTLLVAVIIVLLSIDNAIWEYASYAPLYAESVLVIHLLMLFIYYLIRSKQTRARGQLQE